MDTVSTPAGKWDRPFGNPGLLQAYFSVSLPGSDPGRVRDRYHVRRTASNHIDVSEAAQKYLMVIDKSQKRSTKLFKGF